MADDDSIDPLSGGELDRPKRRGRPDPNAFAAAAALNAAGTHPAVAAEAAAFLREQRELAALQVRYFDEDRVQANDGAKLRRAMDWMKLAMQVAITLVLFTAAILLGRMVWNAAHDHGLMIEGFTVPPDLAASRIDGNQLAAIVADKIAAIEAGSHSFRAEDTFSTDWGNDIKLDVPGTGLSLGELDRTLRRQLGHQTRIGGTLYHDGDALKLSLHTGGESAINVGGDARQIDALAQKAAEALVGQVQPYRYSKYLEFNGRPDEALASARATAASGAAANERAWAWAQVSNLLSARDIPACRTAGYRAIQLDRGNALAFLNTANCELFLGHDQQSADLMKESVRLATYGGGGLSNVGLETGAGFNRAWLAFWAGDYNEMYRVLREPRAHLYGNLDDTSPGAAALALTLLHDQAGARRVPGAKGDVYLATHLYTLNTYAAPGFLRAADLGDWTGALREARMVETALAKNPEGTEIARFAIERFVRPNIALAQVELGYVAEARALAAAFPDDCYYCRRVRGWVLGRSGDMAGANREFAAAVAGNPRLTDADLDWGRLLLLRGDLADAEKHLHRAIELTPKNADPRKYLGDVAVAQGDPAGALGDYAAAALQAPKWGALHLAWARAALMTNDLSTARAHVALAAHLSLSAHDRAWIVAAQSRLGAQ